MLNAKLRNKFNRMTLDRKVQLFLVLSMGLSIIILISVTGTSIIQSITEKSETLVAENSSSKAYNLGTIFDSYESSLRTLEINDSVQNYLKPYSNGNYSSNSTAVYNAMMNILNSTDDIWGLTLLRDGDSTFVNSSLQPSAAQNNFLNEMIENQKSSTKLLKGSITYNIQKVPQEKGYILNIYRPVYNALKIGDKIGLLCIRVDINILKNGIIANEGIITTKIVGTDGKLVIPGNDDDYLNQYPEADRLKGKSGQFTADGKTIVYNKVKDQELYLIDEVPLSYFYEDVYKPIFILLVLSALLLVVLIIISKKIIAGFFRPFNRLREGMHSVSNGDLTVNIEEQDYGDDLKELISGFNGMTERLAAQMKEIIEQEHEVRKNEIEALQESIKPHFLYNTLECIHWQNVADGNQKAAKMVKALARYYRISLDQGEEVISIALELQLIYSYITVQNMRFNDTIDFQNGIPEELYYVKIPRITLQPLVENAIYHGIHAEKESSGWIKTEAVIENDMAIIKVIDSGHEMTAEGIALINRKLSADDKTLGYGVRNVHRRLQLAFGDKYGLMYKLTDTGGTEVDVCVPADREI